MQAWESGRRTPDGPALRLLELARREPRLVFGGMMATTKNARISQVIAKKSTAKKPTSRPKR